MSRLEHGAETGRIPSRRKSRSALVGLVATLLAIEAVFAGDLPHGPVTLVSDLATEEEILGSYPQQPLEAHGRLYFVAEDAQHGRELWRTDGTAEGTELFLDLRPGSLGSSPRLLDAADGLLFFASFDDVLGWALWRTDGSRAGTRLIRRLFTPSGTSSAPIQWLRSVGGRIVYSASISELPAPERELIVGDPWSGEATVVDLCPGSCSSSPYAPYRFEGGVFLVAWSEGAPRSLWRTDGTVEGTERLCVDCAAVISTSPSFAELGPHLYFGGNFDHGELRRTDGTPEGTVIVAELGAGLRSPNSVVRFGSSLFFSAYDNATTRAFLWTSDGTGPGTRPAPELVPALTGASIRDLRSLGSWLYYEVGSGSASTAWAYDGAQPRLLLQTSWGFDFLSRLDDRILLAAGSRVWISDGTPLGTIRLPAPTATASFSPAFSGNVYFAGWETPSGPELWRTDGTVVGTGKLAELFPPHRRAGFGSMLTFRGRQHFVGLRRNQGWPFDARWWSTDGRPEGTMIFDEGPIPRKLVRAGTTLFVADRNDRLLWAFDGDELRGLRVGAGLLDLLETGAELTFTTVEGQSLWKTDGTPEGTSIVRMIHPDWDNSCSGICNGSPQALPAGVTVSAGSLFFLANDADLVQLWVSDGTDAGTKVVKTFDVGPWEDPRFIYDTELVAWNDGVLVATQRPKPRLLRATATGTTPIPAPLPGVSARALTRTDDRVFFVLRSATAVDRLWLTDGTPGGTREVPLPADAVIGELEAVGHRVFLTVHEAGGGAELWVSDGTASGTRRVRDIAAGPRGSYPASLTAADGKLVFAADDGESGQEVWLSDGSGPGTFRVVDLAKGRTAAGPARFTVAGRDVFFEADDGSKRAIFKLDLELASQRLVFADGFESGDVSAWRRDG